MTINNVTGTNSLNANCQPDASTPMISNIHDFMLKLSCEDDRNIDSENNNINFDLDIDDIIAYDPQSDEDECEALLDVNLIIDFDFDQRELNLIESESISQTSISILQKLMKFVHCEECKDRLSSISENDNINDTTFTRNCNKVLRCLNEIIPHICTENLLKKKLVEYTHAIEIDFIGCSEHNDVIVQKMKLMCADCTIKTFCYDINKFLSGKTRTLPDNYNHMQKLAYDDRQKKKYC